jgi:2-polyprenyl-3-methyl-5-hydroxy-6-metoxy-1,4-benzoquinol methylase
MSSTIAIDNVRAAPEEFLRAACPEIATNGVPFCPVCNGSGNSEFASGYDYELRTCANLWKFVQCQSCGHVWLNPRPPVAELGVIYPPNYYAYNYSKINPIARRAKELLDQRKMARILRAAPKLPKSYLDVGCGDGRFLRVLEKRGVPRANLYGLELNESVVGQLREEGYAGVACERVEDASAIPAGGIDLATMFHVIEHVDDPGAVIKRISEWLSPGGLFALETPNLDSWDARIFRGTYWGGYHFPRHWNLFTPATIARLVRKSGLEIVGTTFQTGHSFWMYSLHHAVRYQGASRPRLAELFNPVRSLVGISAFTAVDMLRGAFGANTSAMLVICRKPA